MALDIPCCPTLKEHDCCDRLEFKYTLPQRVTLNQAGSQARVIVEVTLHVRFERCPGPLVLGELAYTTTLLPGEKVRLFSTDRRSRFTFDTETKLSYRHAQASEETFYMASLAREMSDLTISESGSSEATSRGDWGADMDAKWLTFGFWGNTGGSIKGFYDNESTYDFTRSLSRHAESSHYRSQVATRTASSVSIGEVSSRTHTQSESEDHFESSSRIFNNPNHCRAITFFFWQINRVQKIKFTLVAIERRISDPAASTTLESRSLPLPTGVSVIPAGILGSAANRLEVESRAAESIVARAGVVPIGGGVTSPTGSTIGHPTTMGIRSEPPEPLPPTIRREALKQVDEKLVEAGLLDRVDGKVSEEVVKEVSWERELCLPTPGVFVKGCLDDCDICESTVHEQIAIDLERKKLENEMLKKQIDLLEKSQEYRCCPAGSSEEVADQ